jgi:hypothetical protein
MSSRAYSNIEFIPGKKYDLKGSRNQITITGDYVGRSENGDYLFKNKQWFNAKNNYRFDIPDNNDGYSKEDMRELSVTPYKNG